MLNTKTKETLFEQHGSALGDWVRVKMPTMDAKLLTAQVGLALPTMEIRSEASFITACQAWLRKQQCAKFWQEVKDDVVDCIINKISLDDLNDVVEDLTKSFAEFAGKTKGDFLVWVSKELKKHPDFVKGSTVGFFDVRLSDFNDKPDAERLRDFKYVRNGNMYLVKIGEDAQGQAIIWKLPHLWIAKRLWPVKAQRLPGGRYQVVKVVDGEFVPVHRLMFDIGPDQIVKSWNGDLTDFSYVRFRRYSRLYLYSDKNSKPSDIGELVETVQRPNLYIASNTLANPAASERQEKFDGSHAQYPVDAEGKVQEYGQWEDGSLFSEPQEGKNSAANYEEPSKEDRKEANAVRRAMRPEYDKGVLRDDPNAIRGIVKDVEALKQAWGLA
jgi:hypothetical protein